MSSIKKNLFYNTFYQMLLISIPLITTPYLSRTLGANNIGLYSYNYSIAYYFSIFIMLGLNNYGNRTIAMNRDDKKNLSLTFWSIYITQIFMGIVIICIYVIYILYFSSQTVFSWIFMPFLISSLFDINWFFWGIEKFKLTVLRNTAIKLCTAMLIMLVIKSETDIYIYSLLMSISSLISQLIVWPYLKKEIGFIRPKWKDIKIHIKPNLMLFLSVLGVSLYKILDKIMLGNMSSMIQVGYYEQTEKIIAVPLSFIVSLGTVMLPRVSNMYMKKNSDFSTMLKKSLAFSLFFSSSICFGIMAVTNEFVPIFYGPGYESIKPLFYILLPSCIFLGVGNVITTQYLIPMKKDSQYLKSIFLGAVINITLNLFLIPRYAAIGAAIGTLSAEVSVSIYKIYNCSKEMPIVRYLKYAIPYVLSGSIMFLIIFKLDIHIESLLLILLIKICIGLITYFIILFSLIICIKKYKQIHKKTS